MQYILMERFFLRLSMQIIPFTKQQMKLIFLAL